MMSHKRLLSCPACGGPDLERVHAGSMDIEVVVNDAEFGDHPEDVTLTGDVMMCKECPAYFFVDQSVISALSHQPDTIANISDRQSQIINLWKWTPTCKPSIAKEIVWFLVQHLIKIKLPLTHSQLLALISQWDRYLQHNIIDVWSKADIYNQLEQHEPSDEIINQVMSLLCDPNPNFGVTWEGIDDAYRQIAGDEEE